MMMKLLYKRIIRKFRLSKAELNTLYIKLSLENICAGPFIEGSKMCPNTQALQIKLNRTLKPEEVKFLLNREGISSVELWIFYLLFDLPSKISNRIFINNLTKLKESIKELETEVQ